MYKEQFQPWIPGVKVISLNKDDAATVHAMSKGQPRLGKNEQEFLLQLFTACKVADNSINRAMRA